MQPAENAFFCIGINARERIVENKDCRPAQQRPGYGRALFLSAGERDAALAHHGFKSLRKFFELLANVRRLRRLEQVFCAGMGSPKRKVLPNRLAEKKGFLRHHADVAPQHGQRIVAHSAAVDQKGAFGRFVEPGDEVDERGFAGTGWAYNGQAGAGGNPERDVAQHTRMLNVSP